MPISVSSVATPPAKRNRRWRPRTGLAVLSAAAMVLAACGSDDASDGADGNGATIPPIVAGEPISEQRCDANRAAGTIVFLSGFDFAASPGIVEVVTAQAEGYFEQLCLDVDLRPSASPTNLTLLVSGEGHFATAGSFGDVVNVNLNAQSDLVAVTHYGKTSIQALAVPDESPIVSPGDVAGTTMGIKGDLPPDLEAMLAAEGVSRGSFEELLLDIFDPVASFELGVDSLPVYKSNEPAQMDAQGFGYRLFDPADYGVVGSFGVLTTTQSFIDAHPTAAEDFLRASFHGLVFAIDNPDAAVAHAIEAINASGNSFFLFESTESPRWAVESALIQSTTAEGEGIGIPDLSLVESEITSQVEIGRYEDAPDWEPMVNRQLAAGLYDGTTVIWPGE